MESMLAQLMERERVLVEKETQVAVRLDAMHMREKHIESMEQEYRARIDKSLQAQSEVASLEKRAMQTLCDLEERERLVKTKEFDLDQQKKELAQSQKLDRQRQEALWEQRLSVETAKQEKLTLALNQAQDQLKHARLENKRIIQRAKAIHDELETRLPGNLEQELFKLRGQLDHYKLRIQRMDRDREDLEERNRELHLELDSVRFGQQRRYSISASSEDMFQDDVKTSEASHRRQETTDEQARKSRLASSRKGIPSIPASNAKRVGVPARKPFKSTPSLPPPPPPPPPYPTSRAPVRDSSKPLSPLDNLLQARSAMIVQYGPSAAVIAQLDRQIGALQKKNHVG